MNWFSEVSRHVSSRYHDCWKLAPGVRQIAALNAALETCFGAMKTTSNSVGFVRAGVLWHVGELASNSIEILQATTRTLSTTATFSLVLLSISPSQYLLGDRICCSAGTCRSGQVDREALASNASVPGSSEPPSLPKHLKLLSTAAYRDIGECLRFRGRIDSFVFEQNGSTTNFPWPRRRLSFLLQSFQTCDNCQRVSLIHLSQYQDTSY